MNIKIRNLGVMKHADFSIGDFTILCGENNTGKTYVTYALFGFLYSWREYLRIEIGHENLERLFREGIITLDVREYLPQIEQILSKGCQRYLGRLHEIFASHVDRFIGVDFQINMEISDVLLDAEVNSSISGFSGGSLGVILSIQKDQRSSDLTVSFLTDKERVENEKTNKITKEIVIKFISYALMDVLFKQQFPEPFISNAERTGIAIFHNGLNFARSKILEGTSQPDFWRYYFKPRQVDGLSLQSMPMGNMPYMNYVMPVRFGLERMEGLESISHYKSFITEQHPEILSDFSNIVGGNYALTSRDDVYFTPNDMQLSLTMNESSSAVRSLLDIGFYLKHIAMPGDLLMVDEPELNLHPENQRRVARLLSRLVNLGVKVFITTHSDYIIKELNTLIMLNHDKPHLRRIAEQEGYKPEELIAADKIKVYIAEEALVKLDGGHRKTKCQTLTAADIDPFMGIEARSFDTTIAAMNRIQEEIVWGEE